MQFTIQPNPFNGCPGIGFWEELKQALTTARDLFEANTVDSDSSDDSESAPSLADFPFDPDVATVNEMIVGCQEVIDALRDTE
jgi:hypothetical protein